MRLTTVFLIPFAPSVSDRDEENTADELKIENSAIGAGDLQVIARHACHGPWSLCIPEHALMLAYDLPLYIEHT